MLISNHIPKTSGTAWRLYLEANAGSKAAFDTALPHDRQGVGAVVREKFDEQDYEGVQAVLAASGVEILHGHGALKYLDCLPGTPVIAWLRDPRERLISEYVHSKNTQAQSSEGGKPTAQLPEFEDFVRGRSNVYTGISRRCENLGSPLAFMVDQHRGAALDLCQEVLGWRGAMLRRNQTPSTLSQHATELKNQYMNFLTDQLADDLHLYQTWAASWSSGDAQVIMTQVLEAGPQYTAPLGVFSGVRRKFGVWREQIGHALGRDWR